MCRHQQGISLVELMIAMTLGLIISAGVLSIFFSGKSSYRMVEELNSLQENGQFSMYFLTQAIQMAGYESIDTNTLPTPIYADSCSSDAAWCTSNGSGADADRIAIQLNPETNEDCTGAEVDENEVILNVYFLDQAEGISSLYCRGFSPLSATWTSEAARLVDGIDSMQFQFGTSSEDTFQYVSASDVSDWNDVTSVRIAILAATGESPQIEAKERSYAMLDSGLHTYNDRKMRKIYSTTVYITNTF